MNKCGDCILYQTGACADFETQDIDKACDRFLSDERYEEMKEKNCNLMQLNQSQ